MEISTDTCLFGQMPVRPLEYKDDFAEMIDSRYKLVAPQNNQITAKPEEKKNVNKKTIVSSKPVEHKAIIKQSQGAKLFAILNSKKVQPKVAVQKAETVKNVVPKRKLGMSKP